MTTIVTTTNTAPLVYPSTSLIDRSQWSTNLYVMVKASTADTYQLYESRDNGSSWTMILSLVRTGIVEIGSIFISKNPIDILMWVYRTNESNQDRIYYREIVGLGGKLTPAGQTNGWDVEKLVSAVGNGGVAGAVYQGMDLVNVQQGAGIWSIIAVGFTSGANIGIKLFSMYQTAPGRPVLHTDVFPGAPQYLTTGSGRITPSIEIEHTGDSKNSATPNLWVSWGRGTIYCIKIAWNGHTFVPPASATTIVAGVSPQRDYTPARWDGTRFLMPVPNNSASDVNVYQRDKANGTTTILTTPTHPTGVVTQVSISYNGTSGDFRVYAIGTSTNVLYYIDYIRANSTFGSWTQVVATAILGTPPINFEVRRSVYGNIRYDVVTAHSGAPNTIVHTSQTLQYAPLTPSWDFATSSFTASGQACDVNAGLVLDWIFNDVDPTDTQGSYALSRQIGAGTLNYWRASDSTWQLTEQQNTTGTTGVTIPSSWGADSDANHTYRVKVWDSVNNASGYSDPVVVVPSAKDNPTLTAPTAAQVLTTSTVTVTWTASTQTQYRVKLLTNPGGDTYYDSGWVSSTTRSHQPPVILADQSGWTAQVQTKNDEGLTSNTVTVNFSINLVEAPFPTLVLTAIPTSGIIRAVITNPTATGAQPALVDQDLIRRQYAGNDIINVNPYFEVNTSDWTGVSGTLTRSTTQFHEGIASARFVPAGAVATVHFDTGFYNVDPTLLYTAEAAFRFDTTSKFGILRIDWYTTGGALVSSSSVQVQPVISTWTYQLLTNAVVPATAVKCKLVCGVTGTPTATDAINVDEAKLRVNNTDDGKIAAAALAGNVTYDDFQAAAGIEYEYRVVTNATNGAIGYSQWTR